MKEDYEVYIRAYPLEVFVWTNEAGVRVVQLDFEGVTVTEHTESTIKLMSLALKNRDRTNP